MRLREWPVSDAGRRVLFLLSVGMVAGRLGLFPLSLGKVTLAVAFGLPSGATHVRAFLLFAEFLVVRSGSRSAADGMLKMFPLSVGKVTLAVAFGLPSGETHFRASLLFAGRKFLSPAGIMLPAAGSVVPDGFREF